MKFRCMFCDEWITGVFDKNLNPSYWPKAFITLHDCDSIIEFGKSGDQNTRISNRLKEQNVYVLKHLKQMLNDETIRKLPGIGQKTVSVLNHWVLANAWSDALRYAVRNAAPYDALGAAAGAIIAQATPSKQHLPIRALCTAEAATYIEIARSLTLAQATFECESQALRAERNRLREALIKAREWITHDWECELHVFQWDENQARGIKRQGEKCTCDLANKEAFIDAALKS